MQIHPPQNLVDAIKKNKFSFKKDAQIVFVCGRALDTAGSKRKVFLEYASRQLPWVHLLLAEEFFNCFSHTTEDILTLEDEMSRYADCIIVILESESAHCELGAFAVDNDLAKKIIVINESKYKYSTSFISRGPIQKISKLKGGPCGVIHVEMESMLSCAKEINNLIGRLKKRRAERVKFDDYNILKSSKKRRLLFLCDIINLMSPVTYRELISIFKEVYGEKKFNFLQFDIHMLEALKFIKRVKNDTGDSYFLRSCSGLMFIDMSFNYELKIRSDAFLAYKKNDPSRLCMLS